MSLARANSGGFSFCLGGQERPRAPAPACGRAPALPRRGAGLARAAQAPPDQPGALLSSVRKFTRRHDPLAVGTGALLVGGYCVAVHGQSVGVALNIAAAATVLGMVLQELLFLGRGGNGGGDGGGRGHGSALGAAGEGGGEHGSGGGARPAQ